MNNTGVVLQELRHVEQIYGQGPRAFVALKGVNISISEGEFVCLLGPSGCGKSTLLRLITGLQRATGGEILYRSAPLTGVNPHSVIVFQTFALFPWLTVQDNVEVALKARGIGLPQRAKRALDLLERVGLSGFENAYPRELSGGMRQKVGFARAMAIEPELLCLDEPFSALDVLSADTLRSDLMELWTGGKIPTKAILMVTHNIHEAVEVADRIIVMDKGPGRVVCEVKIDLPHPRHRKDPRFLELVDAVYTLLAGQTQSEHVEMGAAPGESGVMRSLPPVTISEIAGLAEHMLAGSDGKVDLYRVADDFKMQSDDLLKLIEAMEILGFATVAKGDISLTPLGETFGDAGIQGRKEILAARLRRMPFFKWMLSMLRAADSHSLERDIVEAAISMQFHEKELQRHMDTALNWARYAELITYDDNKEVIFIEEGNDAAHAAVQ